MMQIRISVVLDPIIVCIAECCEWDWMSTSSDKMESEVTPWGLINRVLSRLRISVWVDGEGWSICVSDIEATIWKVNEEFEINVNEFLSVNSGGRVNFVLKIEH